MTTAPKCLTPGPRTGWSTWRVTRGESQSAVSSMLMITPSLCRWWDVIWEKAAKAGVEEITMTPEHGPPNYQVSTSDRVTTINLALIRN